MALPDHHGSTSDCFPSPGLTLAHHTGLQPGDRTLAYGLTSRVVLPHHHEPIGLSGLLLEPGKSYAKNARRHRGGRKLLLFTISITVSANYHPIFQQTHFKIWSDFWLRFEPNLTSDLSQKCTSFQASILS